MSEEAGEGAGRKIGERAKGGAERRIGAGEGVTGEGGRRKGAGAGGLEEGL